MEEKQRMIQEYVPGKQVTLAHLIANPDEVIFEKLGLQAEIKDAIGILTITPSEAAIIAVDIATKAADVQSECCHPAEKTGARESPLWRAHDSYCH